MNKTIILAALFGVLSYEEVHAKHHHHHQQDPFELALLALEDETNNQDEELVNIGGEVYAVASTNAEYQKDLDKAMKALDKKVIAKHAKKAMKGAAKKIRAKESSSDTDSSTDEERHESYKGKDRKKKDHLRVYHPSIAIPHHQLSKHATRNPQQTVESLLKAAAQAKN